jgi:hypothetical protein
VTESEKLVTGVETEAMLKKHDGPRVVADFRHYVRVRRGD